MMGLKSYQIRAVDGRQRMVISKDRNTTCAHMTVLALGEVAKAAKKLVRVVDGGQETREAINDALDNVRHSLQVLDSLDDTVVLTPAGRAALGKGA